MGNVNCCSCTLKEEENGNVDLLIENDDLASG